MCGEEIARVETQFLTVSIQLRTRYTQPMSLAGGVGFRGITQHFVSDGDVHRSGLLFQD